MEVHAHTHTPGKRWTHYLWEFLMLFLAVFCGFLAENQREHMVEHQRAKIYAANLYEELKKDTADIDNTIQNIKFTTGKLDSFCLLSSEKLNRNITNGLLYYYASYTTSINFYTSDNTTIEQLKSSGNLRIMANAISQKINVYGKELNELENEYGLTRLEFAKIEDLYFKLFDGYTTELLFRNGKDRVRDSVFKLNIPLIHEDPALMKEFTGWQKFEVSVYLNQITNYLVPLKQTATELIALLKKEYHLE
jgi:predicted RNA-binding protein with PIN domain